MNKTPKQYPDFKKIIIKVHTLTDLLALLAEKTGELEKIAKAIPKAITAVDKEYMKFFNEDYKDSLKDSDYGVEIENWVEDFLFHIKGLKTLKKRMNPDTIISALRDWQQEDYKQWMNEHNDESGNDAKSSR